MPLLEAPKGFVFRCEGYSAWHEPKTRKSRKAPSIPLKYKETLTLTEVAELLSVSRETVLRAITLKRRSTAPLLRTIRIGGAIRVTRQDLDNYIYASRLTAGIPTNKDNERQ